MLPYLYPYGGIIPAPHGTRFRFGGSEPQVLQKEIRPRKGQTVFTLNVDQEKNSLAGPTRLELATSGVTGPLKSTICDTRATFAASYPALSRIDPHQARTCRTLYAPAS